MIVFLDPLVVGGLSVQALLIMEVLVHITRMHSTRDTYCLFQWSPIDVYTGGSPSHFTDTPLQRHPFTKIPFHRARSQRLPFTETPSQIPPLQRRPTLLRRPSPIHRDPADRDPFDRDHVINMGPGTGISS